MSPAVLVHVQGGTVLPTRFTPADTLVLAGGVIPLGPPNVDQSYTKCNVVYGVAQLNN